NLPISVTSFDPDLRDTDQFQKRLEKIIPGVRFQNYDPDIRPDIAEKYGVEEYGNTFLEMGDRFLKVPSLSLKYIAEGLTYLYEQQQKEVCFFTSQNSLNPMDEGSEGFSALAGNLERIGIKWKNVSPLQDNLPAFDSCNVIVVGGVDKPLLSAEWDFIGTMLDTGKNFIFLLEPEMIESISSNWFSARTNIMPAPETVYRPREEKRLNLSSKEILTNNFNEIENPLPYITKNLTYVLFENPVALIAPERPNIYPILYSLRFDKLAEIGEKKSSEILSPFLLAAATNNGKNKLVLLGDSQFARNRLIDYGSNRQLILKCIFWTLGEKEGLALMSTVATSSELIDMPLSYLPWVKIILLFIVPGLCFSGLFMLWRKL
ncbi:MAG: hypothetical protein V1746_00355, partial [bacterium]